MKKAVLSNRIYLNFEEELYEKIKEELTYKIPSKVPGDPPLIKRTYNIIGNKFISFPIGRQDLIPKNYEIVDKRAVVPAAFPDFKFTLREEQQKIYDAVNDNCLINANTSWGKTFMAIAIATKLKQKTLVITHTVNLRDQWSKEIKKTLGIKAGVIGSGQFSFAKYPIVVANVQTVRKHVQRLKNEFGLVVLDEVHHTPATIFSSTIDGLSAKYKIGLSATLKRKDFLHILIPDYFSNKVYIPKEENQMTPEVYMFQTSIPFSSNNMIPWANRVNELVARPEYLDLVTSISEGFADKGHCVLTVSDRTEFIFKCAEVSGDRAVAIDGPTKDKDSLHKMFMNYEKDILYGAISLYKEGISINTLSCLVLAAPTNNEPLLDQLKGRITRKYSNKLTPVIVDIVLKGATAKKQSATRAGYYIRKGWKITHVDLTQK